MAVTRDNPAPYAPASAILALINRHRNKGLPSPIDADTLMRAGISESLVPRTLHALATLDLVNEQGGPSDVLEGLRLAPETEFQKRLGEWLTSAYADALSFVDPVEDDEVRIRDAFRSYRPTGQQDRMVSLFVGLFTAAGVMPERSRVQVKSSVTPARTKAIAKRFVANSVAASSKVDAPTLNTAGSIPLPLQGLLSSLPSEGQGWSGQRRDAFITAFSAMLNFCFPIEADVQPKQEGGKADAHVT